MRRTGALAELAKRVYWREDDARRIVEAWQDSGEPISRFARRLGVDWRRVSRWARRLGRSEEARLRFHPVRVTDEHARAAYIDIEVGRQLAQQSAECPWGQLAGEADKSTVLLSWCQGEESAGRVAAQDAAPSRRDQSSGSGFSQV